MLNQGLKPADFRFEFPAGSGYINISTGEKFIGEEYLRRDKLVVAAAQQKQEKHENPVSNRWIWFVGVTVGIIIVLWVLYRRFAGVAIITLAALFSGRGLSGPEHDAHIQDGQNALIEIKESEIRSQISAEALRLVGTAGL